MKKHVVVGMSGGVDSSVAAALLKEQGYEVTALFMKNWEEASSEGCSSASDYEDVAKTAEILKIPFYSVNFVKEYREKVFDEFLQDLKEGLTPNPDILCNREIKFQVFFEKALELGADFLATGHYCQIDERGFLKKGKDPEKDQSYFLYQVDPLVFQKVLFPIGHLHKSEVRALARKYQLPTSEKKDSTGICFIGKRNFKKFVSTYLNYTKGDLKTLSGEKVGTHDGVAYYTLGQRQGIGLGGEGEPWYVVDKDPKTNTVYVERGHNHPKLFQKEIFVRHLFWNNNKEQTFPLQVLGKIRYRQKDQKCTLYPPDEKGNMKVTFEEPQRAITAGQSAVFYENDLCLGGGIIL